MQPEPQPPDIPELRIVRRIVELHMPAGHRLKDVDLSFGVLEEGQEPRFLVLIELEQEARAPEPYGWIDKVIKIIRQQWPDDDFYVKLKVGLA